MDIRFSDHASFHKAALGMVGCALLFGLALHQVSPLAGGLLGIAAGASIAHGRGGRRRSTPRPRSCATRRRRRACCSSKDCRRAGRPDARRL